jgi:hypothetical protein
MRIPNSLFFIETGSRKCTGILTGMLLIPLLSMLLACQGPTNSRKETGQAPADYPRLAGTWVRPDGGYMLEIKDVGPDGGMKAGYFNPNPIHVAKAEWQRTEGRLQVFVELRDVNYPGSTYKLVYFPENDTFAGVYHQAMQNQDFDVGFMRVK